MMRPGVRTLALAALGAGLVLCLLGGAALRMPDDVGAMARERTELYVAWAAAAGVLYAAAVALVAGAAPGLGRRALAAVLLLAVVMRVVTVLPPPLQSTDAYRYVWDGRVQAAGINPYRYLPAAKELAGLRDEGVGAGAVYPNINRADTAPTIYPPFAQAIFAAVAQIWPSLWGIKAVMLAFDLLAVGAALLLLRAARMPPERALIYAWNPLVLWEFAGGAHIDAAAVGLSALAILAAVRVRPALAGGALGLAVLCKLLPAALFPALWRRWDWRTPLACGAVIAAGYACYAGVGWRVFGYLPGYASEERLADGGVVLLRLAALFGPLPSWAGPGYLALALAGLAALAVAVVRRPLPSDPARRAVAICTDALWLSAATMAALSPHYPWYLAVLAWPAVLAPRASALWLTLAAPAMYLDPDHDQVLWPALVFLPFAGLLAWELLRPARLPLPAVFGGS